MRRSGDFDGWAYTALWALFVLPVWILGIVAKELWLLARVAFKEPKPLPPPHLRYRK